MGNILLNAFYIFVLRLYVKEYMYIFFPYIYVCVYTCIYICMSLHIVYNFSVSRTKTTDIL